MVNIITDQTIAEAERWHEIFAGGERTYKQRADFTNWYEGDVSHQKAYAQVAFVKDAGFDFSKIDFAGLESNHPLNLKPKPRLPFVRSLFANSTFGYGGAIAVLMAVVIFMVPYLSHPDLTEYATQTGSTQTIILADGSEVLLGARSTMNVREFLGEERVVYLEKGEALFTVKKDKNRPFIVVSGDTRIQVLGTKFNVNKAEKNLKVSLLEGRVKVIQDLEGDILPFLKQQKTVELLPAHSVTVSKGVLQQVKPQEIKNMAAWVDGQLTYNNIPFGQVIADLRRYTPKDLLIADGELENIPVTATFSTEQVENVIENLPSILPVKIVRNSSGGYIFKKK